MGRWLVLYFIILCAFSRAQQFDPAKPDYDLLNRLVLEKINAKRDKKSKVRMVVNEHLQKAAVYYTDKFVLHKFENNGENRMRIKKRVRKICKDNGFTSRFIDFSIATTQGVNYFGKKFYYDADDSTTDVHLFIGDKRPSRSERNKEDFKSVPLKEFTYEELAAGIAARFLHDKGHFKTLNNAYDQIGISCAVEPRSLGKRKLPKIKAIIIVGGKLINW